MLYLIYGTNLEKRNLARAKIKDNLKKFDIDFYLLLKVPDIDKYNYKLILTYLNNNSLFGEKILINIYNILDIAESRDFIYEHLKDLIESPNVFIIDETLAKVATFQKLERDFNKLNIINNIYNASEKIEKEDIDPFPLCNYLELRNKKEAWLEWKRIYSRWEDSEAMALHGALWWKWKNIWSNYLDEDSPSLNYANQSKTKSSNLKYSKQELEKIGKELAFLAMRNNNGEINLMREIEKLILEI